MRIYQNYLRTSVFEVGRTAMVTGIPWGEVKTCLISIDDLDDEALYVLVGFVWPPRAEFLWKYIKIRIDGLRKSRNKFVCEKKFELRTVFYYNLYLATGKVEVWVEISTDLD